MIKVMRLLFIFFFCYISFLSSAQVNESIYVHTDKETYFPGEIMWFRVYSVRTGDFTPLHHRSVAYIDLADQGGASVLQYKVETGASATNGGSVFIPQRLAAGTYTLTGATFASEARGRSFSKKITVLNPFAITDTPLASVQNTYAVHLFPEGGTLVKGIPTRVGFKVTDAWGKGVQASLRLPDGTRAVSNAYGIGSFPITPDTGSKVVAEFPDGTKKEQSLPPVADTGYILNAEDRGDHYRIVIRSHRSGDPLLLESEAPDGKTVRHTLVLNSSGTAEHILPRTQLRTGTSRLTLLRYDQAPLAERIVFRKPEKILGLRVATKKPVFSTRETITLSLGRITAGSSADVSVSVKKLDDIQAASGESPLSYFYLRRDLAGEVEHPDHYLANSTELENLLLTHGWRTFKNGDAAGEGRYHHIRIRFTDKTTGNPLAGQETLLTAPSRTAFLYTAETDSAGVATFQVKNLYGTQNLAASLLSGEPAHAELLKFQPESGGSLPLDVRGFSSENYREYAINVQVENIYSGKNRSSYLPPATLDTLPIFGRAEARYRLDDYTRFVVMEEVMREYVREVAVRKNRGNFHFRNLDAIRGHHYSNDPLILLDGVPVPDANRIMEYDPLKVEFIDVVTRRFYIGKKEYDGIVSYTTYKGVLEGYTMDPSFSVFTYEGLQPEREFYVPATPRTPGIPDHRTVLYWTPRLFLKGAENQEITFSASDLPGDYEVDVQGIDSSGAMGSVRLQFKVETDNLKK